MNGKGKISSLTGLLILLGIIVFGFIVVNRLSIRYDATEDKLYTLSEGTDNILANLQDPVTFKFFYSKSLEGVPPQFKNYANRVLAMLEEYLQKSEQLNLEIIDPEPDSEEEELAQRYGIQGQALAPGINFYFGLVVSNFSGEESIPYFDMRREMFLEYDVTRSIYLLNLSGKPKVGILSALKVLGDEAPPQQFGAPPPQDLKKPWLFTMELKKFYDLQKVAPDVDQIPSDLNLLIVMHAKDIKEKTQYAIDQYVMSGKNVIFFVDPMYMNDQQQGNPYQPPAPNNGLDKLFDKWGVEFKSDHVVLDPLLAASVPTRQGVVKHPAILQVNNSVVSKEDVVTAQLNQMVMLYPGSIKLKEGQEGIKFTPLISTTARAKSKEKFKVMYSQPNEMGRDLRGSGDPLVVSALIDGKFKSAFDKAPDGVTTPYRGEAAEESSILIVADIDMLEDRYCIQEINFMGQVLGYQPINQNTIFLNNAVEKMTGNRDLISLRSRGKFARPFDKVAEMERAARDEWQEKEQALQQKQQDLQNQINERLKKTDPNQQVVISSVVQAEIDKFRDEMRKVNKELRDVRRNLRGDIESLGTTLKAFNILFIPLLIGIFGMFMAISKSRRVGS